MKDEIENFIEFIKELVNDEFSIFIDNIDAGYYFMNGGCLELAKVLKRYIPSSKIVIHKSLDHFAIQYKDKVYDASGKVEDSFQFYAISSDYLKEWEEYYGRNIKFYDKTVDEALIHELNNCSGNYVKDMINHINSN